MYLNPLQPILRLQLIMNTRFIMMGMAQYRVPRKITYMRLTFCNMPFAVSLCLLLWPQASNKYVMFCLLSFLKRKWEVALEIALLLARNSRSSRATCCSWHSVMLPAETFEMRKRLLTLSLAQLRQKTEAILKNYELFIYGDLQCITDPSGRAV